MEKVKKRRKHKMYGPYERYVKRPLDFILSLTALSVLSPLLCTVSILIVFDMGLPVIFKQYRIGKDDKEFSLYKFRSMTNERDKNGVFLPGISAKRRRRREK